uniref:Pollen-specific kinase partner protein n=1 Tax=Solanum tuberosum TaxID=4113 RepID=M1B9T4_SOLTU
MVKEENKYQKSRSFNFRKILELPSKLAHSIGGESSSDDEEEIGGGGIIPLQNQQIDSTAFDPSLVSTLTTKVPKAKPSDMELMKERFSKMLLGEDMSGGGKGVSSALALSNAITNLAASIFGEQSKLEPMSQKRKERWRKEIDWLLSVTDYIVEFVPGQQKSKDGTNMEDCLDNFKDAKEFWYISKDADDSEKGVQRSDKWWLPTIKVPPKGLSDESRRWLQYQKDCVNQVLKASMAINAQILAEMEVPENYIDSLPKNGRSSLGDSIYKNITVEFFDPEQFLSTMDMSSEHKVVNLKDRIEASIVIWKRKMHQKDAKSSWVPAVSLEKRELFEERAETILLLIKHRFPEIPQSSLEISKIQYNRDVGYSVLESYSRVLESLANTVTSRIEDVLYADSVAQDPSLAIAKWNRSADSSPQKPQSVVSTPKQESDCTAETPTSMTLFDFMGWNMEQGEADINKTNLEALPQT